MSKYKSKMTNLLKEWKDERKISYHLRKKLYPSHEETAKFHGVPKMHTAQAYYSTASYSFQRRKCHIQGVYAKTGHSNIFTYLTFDFKTSTVVQQNDVFS